MTTYQFSQSEKDTMRKACAVLEAFLARHGSRHTYSTETASALHRNLEHFTAECMGVAAAVNPDN